MSAPWKQEHLLILVSPILLVLPIINNGFNKVKNRINSLLKIKVQYFSTWLENKGENYSKLAPWFFPPLHWRRESSFKMLLNSSWLKKYPVECSSLKEVTQKSTQSNKHIWASIYEGQAVSWSWHVCKEVNSSLAGHW